jgi:polar amino acid transport system substrate-binding protein
MKRLLTAALVAMAFGVQAPSQAQQVLKVGIQEAGVPLNFIDSKSNTAQGLCVDVMTEIAKDANFTAHFEPMAFGSLLSALTRDEIDIIASNMSSTPERQALADFSNAYFSYGEALVVPVTDTKNYTSVEEMKGMVVGTIGGSTYVAQLTKAGASVKTYAGSVDVLRDVNDGRIAAGLGGAPIVKYFLGQGTNPRVRLVKSYQPKNLASIAFVVRKTDGELLGKINASLARLQSDGTITKLAAKWGLE